MEVFSIPVEGRYIIYRPLLRLAFVGNRAMADLALALAEQDLSLGAAVSSEAHQFLDFKGLPQVERVAHQLALDAVYVPLHARPEMPSGETWLRVAGRDWIDEEPPAAMVALEKNLQRIIFLQGEDQISILE